MGTNRNAPRTTALWVSAKALLAFAALICALPLSKPVLAQQQQARPNILVIFGDDIGQSNISAYSHGLVGYKTPNIDRIAKEGMMFTDYYAENSCTAGRSTFITGQVCLRTGLCKVGIPGATVGLATQPASSARTISGTAMNIFRPNTASMNSLATSITSTPKRSRRARTIPRTMQISSGPNRPAASLNRRPTAKSKTPAR